MVSKQDILERLRARVAADLASLIESQKRTQAGAVHEESRPEDDKDTRAIEASYLARGLAERVEKLQHASAALSALRLRNFGAEEPVAVGALVTLKTPQREVLYFVAPAAGGFRLEIDGTQITTVTPTAPLGKAMVGLSLDEEVEFESPHGLQHYEIVDIC